jgi:hypothetical protein
MHNRNLFLLFSAGAGVIGLAVLVPVLQHQQVLRQHAQWPSQPLPTQAYGNSYFPTTNPAETANGNITTTLPPEGKAYQAPNDTIPPTVTITSPQNGSQVQAVLSLSMVDNAVCSPKRLTILIDPASSSFRRKLSMPHISSSEDRYGPSCVLVPARVLPHTLSGAALASVLAPSSAFPLKSRGHAYHSPTSPAPPRTPLDCPTCSLSCAHSSVVGSAPIACATLA